MLGGEVSLATRAAAQLRAIVWQTELHKVSDML